MTRLNKADNACPDAPPGLDTWAIMAPVRGRIRLALAGDAGRGGLQHGRLSTAPRHL